MRKLPRVYLIGQTKLIPQAIDAYFEDIGTSFRVQDSPEALLEIAGRLCYRSWEPGMNKNVTKIRPSESYVGNILNQGHLSVFEHVHLTFLFQNVTRVLTHELVRHRIGGFSQESLRYVRLDDLDFFIPNDIATDYPEVAIEMEKWFLQNSEKQKELAVTFGLDDPNTPFEKKKRLTSFMRRFAPIGLCTNIIWTTNLRNLRHVFSQRLSEHAEVEIRGVFHHVKEIVKPLYPNVFGDIE